MYNLKHVCHGTMFTHVRTAGLLKYPVQGHGGRIPDVPHPSIKLMHWQISTRMLLGRTTHAVRDIRRRVASSVPSRPFAFQQLSSPGLPTSTTTVTSSSSHISACRDRDRDGSPCQRLFGCTARHTRFPTVTVIGSSPGLQVRPFAFRPIDHPVMIQRLHPRRPTVHHAPAALAQLRPAP